MEIQSKKTWIMPEVEIISKSIQGGGMISATEKTGGRIRERTTSFPAPQYQTFPATPLLYNSAHS